MVIKNKSTKQIMESSMQSRLSHLKIDIQKLKSISKIDIQKFYFKLARNFQQTR